jgi:hypothetical protein
MKAKIDQQKICIPPYISTTWDQVAFLRTREAESGETILQLHLKDGSMISIPNLDSSLVDIAFSAHLKHLEENQKEPKQEGRGGLFQILGVKPDQLLQMPMQMGIAGIPGIDSIESLMQHNLAKADTEDLPPEMLDKVSHMAKMFMGGDLSMFPKPEPHCNCTHCQVARAIHGVEKEDEEEVSEEELSFRDWEIEKRGENLYEVINPLDSTEHYTVYLGSPVGCTCGEDNCEHIKAVLMS